MVVVAKELAKRSLDKTSGGDIGCGMGNANQLCKTEKGRKAKHNHLSQDRFISLNNQKMRQTKNNKTRRTDNLFPVPHPPPSLPLPPLSLSPSLLLLLLNNLDEYPLPLTPSPFLSPTPPPAPPIIYPSPPPSPPPRPFPFPFPPPYPYPYLHGLNSTEAGLLTLPSLVGDMAPILVGDTSPSLDVLCGGRGGSGRGSAA